MPRMTRKETLTTLFELVGKLAIVTNMQRDRLDALETECAALRAQLERLEVRR